jgi:hypothetical protein
MVSANDISRACAVCSNKHSLQTLSHYQSSFQRAKLRKGRALASDSWILEGIDRLAMMKYGRRGRSKMIFRVLQMYLNTQGNDNHQRTFQSDHPPVTDVEREKAGIRFLKAKCKLSLRQISGITARAL